MSRLKQNTLGTTADDNISFDIKTELDSNNNPDTKLMNQYNKCIYALVHVLTQRMQIFYKCEFEEPHDRMATEVKFSNVLAKILTKMKQIEDKLGKNKSQQLMPFTNTLKPILKVLGIKLVHNDSISKQISEGNYQFLTLAKQREIKLDARRNSSQEIEKKRNSSLNLRIKKPLEQEQKIKKTLDQKRVSSEDAPKVKMSQRTFKVQGETRNISKQLSVIPDQKSYETVNMNFRSSYIKTIQNTNLDQIVNPVPQIKILAVSSLDKNLKIVNKRQADIKKFQQIKKEQMERLTNRTQNQRVETTGMSSNEDQKISYNNHYLMKNENNYLNLQKSRLQLTEKRSNKTIMDLTEERAIKTNPNASPEPQYRSHQMLQPLHLDLLPNNHRKLTEKLPQNVKQSFYKLNINLQRQDTLRTIRQKSKSINSQNYYTLGKPQQNVTTSSIQNVENQTNYYFINMQPTEHLNTDILNKTQETTQILKKDILYKSMAKTKRIVQPSPYQAEASYSVRQQSCDSNDITCPPIQIQRFSSVTSRDVHSSSTNPYAVERPSAAGERLYSEIKQKQISKIYDSKSLKNLPSRINIKSESNYN